MKRFISNVLILGVCLTPLTVPLMVQPSWAQSQNSQLEKLKQLQQQALQQIQQGQHRQAIETLQQVLAIARQFTIRNVEAFALTAIGFNYNSISQPQEALKYFNQALPITRSVGDRRGEAVTLNNIGAAYNSISQPQEALKYYNQALPIRREVGDRMGEAATLNNIGFAYRDTKQPTQAINNLQQSIQITLEIRSGLQRENRQKFLEAKSGSVVALTSLLIDQNQADRAFQWVNIATTADLADYTRLINAKVANPQAQTAIDEWNPKKSTTPIPTPPTRRQILRKSLPTNAGIRHRSQPPSRSNLPPIPRSRRTL
jgi:tetratricopeptide (TPR) repeat protein